MLESVWVPLEWKSYINTIKDESLSSSIRAFPHLKLGVEDGRGLGEADQCGLGDDACVVMEEGAQFVTWSVKHTIDNSTPDPPENCHLNV